MKQHKYKELNARIEQLEAKSEANTMMFGKVDLLQLAKIVENLQSDIKKLSAATDRNKI